MLSQASIVSSKKKAKCDMLSSNMYSKSEADIQSSDEEADISEEKITIKSPVKKTIANHWPTMLTADFSSTETVRKYTQYISKFLEDHELYVDKNMQQQEIANAMLEYKNSGVSKAAQFA